MAVDAWALVEHDGPELLHNARLSIEAAMRELPEFCDISVVLPADTAAGVIDVTVLVRAPNGPDREAARSAAMDAVAEAFPAIPGIRLSEIGLADI